MDGDGSRLLVYASQEDAYRRGDVQSKVSKRHNTFLRKPIESLENDGAGRVLLLNAERAWAMALDLKTRAEFENVLSRKTRFCLISRLKRACYWAERLESCAVESCDVRSRLEIIGYRYRLRAKYHLERGEYEDALRCYKTSSAVYGELGLEKRTSGIVARAGYERVRALCDPGIELCRFHLGGGVVELDGETLFSETVSGLFASMCGSEDVGLGFILPSVKESGGGGLVGGDDDDDMVVNVEEECGFMGTGLLVSGNTVMKSLFRKCNPINFSVFFFNALNNNYNTSE